ncbi:hypothetical protein B0A55_06393 [Friedmanniomyces simplex]|uniref:BTB domain-containing protein n=1 Tax=Friedmanniomyces simplex TaxID=329884 RepID=A0A4V5NGP6_9PEZI|nr:hypothetical protein B0A55_06393 [Friedmanniomyces simplex]
MTSRSDDAEALRYHVYSQFCNPTLADCHLQIVERESGARQYLDAHKIILSRSPTLLDIIQTSESPISAALKTQVPVHLRDHNLRIKPFMDCVRYLYGGSLTTLNQLIQTSVNSEAPTKNEERMELVLQYVAIAAWLRLPAVAARAMDTTLSLLHWDTMAAVLAFALDGGLGPSFTVEDGSEMSCASSDDSLGRADGIGMPTYDPYSTNLLHRVINFTVHMFPPNFYLDATAPQLASPPRLPPLPPAHESRPSRSDPRLSQIRFGELSLEDHKMPSLVTTTISSLLLSLPFPLLKCVLEHNGMVFQLGPDTVASIMRQVVAEREVRRKRVLQARTAGQTEDGAGLLLVQNLYFEERVEASALHRAGFRVARTKRGVDTPPSSGPGSEGSKQG